MAVFEHYHVVQKKSQIDDKIKRTGSSAYK